jgi:imidazolonepropionase-like amidohydrolase
MKRLSIVFFAVVIGMSAAAPVSAQDLVITNARIIVGNGQVIERGSLVVRAGRIASVAAGAAAAQAGTQTIDARGMTVMAGFIDAHRHIMQGNADQWFKTRAAAAMQEFFDAGYTTLMEGGGQIPGILQLKEKIEKGELKGPRIITSARADPSDYKTEEAARARVRQIKQAGIDIVKARIEPPADPQEVALLTIVGDEARKQNIGLMVHAVSPKAMVAAVKAGATKLVHTPHNGWLTQADIKVVKDAGLPMLSTIGFGVPVFGVFNKDNKPTFRDGKPWPEAVQGGIGDGREAGEKAVNGRMLWDAGITYGFGTDTGYLPKDGLAHELKALNLVYSPQDLIKLMGPNSAVFIDKSNDRGTLEAGKLADLVILDGNPLDGYWNLLNAKVTIKGGVIVADKR